MNRRTLITLVVILALAAGGFFGYRQFTASAQSNATTLQTAPVERGVLTATVSAAGTIAVPQSATLVWQASGVVGAVLIAAGDTVKAGDVLLELDPASLDRTVVQAQADLIGAKQALDTLLAGPTDQQLAQAKLNVVQTQQAATTAQWNLNSVLNPVGQSLLDSITAAQIAYDSAQTDLTLEHVSQDAIQVQTTQNTMNMADSQLQRAQAEYDDCLKISCGERVRRENALTNAQNAYQTALDNFQAAQLQYNTKVNSLSYNADIAKETLGKAQANLAVAQAGPDPAKVALYQAQLDLAKANLDQAQSDLATLQAGPDPDNVAAAQARVTAAQATVDQARLVAPFGATVVAVYNQVGDSVSNNLSAVALADLSYLEVQVDVSELDVNSILIGQEASLTLDAAPGQTFAGRVADVAFLGMVDQGVATFPVTVVIPDPDPALKPGMTAAVSIVVDRRENVLMVPNRAVQVSGGQRAVTVLFEGQQISVPVSLGLMGETMSEVVEGALQEGDAVVVNLPSATQGQPGGGGGFFGPGTGFGMDH